MAIFCRRSTLWQVGRERIEKEKDVEIMPKSSDQTLPRLMLAVWRRLSVSRSSS